MIKGENGAISIICVGDLLIQREDPESTFSKTRSIFDADILFGNLEGVMSDVGEMLPWSGHNFHRMDSRMVSGIEGFHVVSLANNHVMDFGPEALSQCLGVLSEKKIAWAGAGMDSFEARRPAVLERKGTRIAFLAYTSVGVDGPLPYVSAIAAIFLHSEMPPA